MAFWDSEISQRFSSRVFGPQLVGRHIVADGPALLSFVPDPFIFVLWHGDIAILAFDFRKMALIGDFLQITGHKRETVGTIHRLNHSSLR